MNRKEIYIRATRSTPGVVFSDGRFLICGRSIPEKPAAFYRLLYDWMLVRVKRAEGTPVIELGFEYINSASAKWVFLILRDLAFAGISYRVIWYYETGDDDMLELGYMFKTLLCCPLATVEVDNIPVTHQM